MLKRLIAVSSLFLVFAISGCGLFADYELAFKKDPADTDKTVEVEVRKKGESKKVEDDADGHDLEVTLSVECGDDSKDIPEKAVKGTATFDTKDFPGSANDSCTVKAKADDAKSTDEVTFKRG